MAKHQPLDPGMHNVVLLESVPGHIAGDVMQVDNLSADSLIRRGLAKVYDAAKDEAPRSAAGQRQSLRAGVVTTTVSAGAAGVTELPPEAQLAEEMRQVEEEALAQVEAAAAEAGIEVSEVDPAAGLSGTAAPDAQSAGGDASGTSRSKRK